MVKKQAKKIKYYIEFFEKKSEFEKYLKAVVKNGREISYMF